MNRGATLALVLAACVVQSACSDSRAPGNFHLATVAAVPEQGLLFVAQPGRDVVDVLSIASSGHVARLASPPGSHIIRLAVDRDRGRLWVVAFKSLRAYALPGLEELRSYDLPASSYHERFSDLVLDGAGNAFVLARGGARIYRIDGASLGLERWLDLADRASDAALLLANRALRSADDRYLYFPSPTDGVLLRVDLRSKQVTAAADGVANLTCGLLFWDHGAAHGPAQIRAFDCTGVWEARAAPADGKALVALRGERRLSGTVTRFDRYGDVTDATNSQNGIRVPPELRE